MADVIRWARCEYSTSPDFQIGEHYRVHYWGQLLSTLILPNGNHRLVASGNFTPLPPSEPDLDLTEPDPWS